MGFWVCRASFKNKIVVFLLCVRVWLCFFVVFLCAALLVSSLLFKWNIPYGYVFFLVVRLCFFFQTYIIQSYANESRSKKKQNKTHLLPCVRYLIVFSISKSWHQGQSAFPPGMFSNDLLNNASSEVIWTEPWLLFTSISNWTGKNCVKVRIMCVLCLVCRKKKTAVAFFFNLVSCIQQADIWLARKSNSGNFCGRYSTCCFRNYKEQVFFCLLFFFSNQFFFFTFWVFFMVLCFVVHVVGVMCAAVW